MRVLREADNDQEWGGDPAEEFQPVLNRVAPSPLAVGMQFNQQGGGLRVVRAAVALGGVAEHDGWRHPYGRAVAAAGETTAFSDS